MFKADSDSFCDELTLMLLQLFYKLEMEETLPNLFYQSSAYYHDFKIK